MSRTERINKAVKYLKFKGIISENKDISVKMEVNNSSISSALNGNEKYLTNSFISKFCKAFPMINKSWILKDEGEMLNEPNLKNENMGTKSYEQLENELQKANEKIVRYERIIDALTLKNDELINKQTGSQ